MKRAQRKLDHIQGAMVEKETGGAGFEHVTFIHQSLPECDLRDVSLQSGIGELTLSSPIFINAMTGGGGEETFLINQGIARVARKTGVAMAVGSQMAAVKDQAQRYTYEVVREENPDGILFANLGMDATAEQAKEAVDIIAADALQIHLNVIQELVMPEGDRSFSTVLARLEQIVQAINVPVIVKEVGFGMSYETARSLQSIGVAAVDVAGFGGTNFSRIENDRRTRSMDFFNEWGIPTTCALAELRLRHLQVPVLGSGGITSPLDVVKALALGASAVGVAGIALRTFMSEGEEALEQLLVDWHNDMITIMTALGVTKPQQLSSAPILVSGYVHHWLTERGLYTSEFAQPK
ncbi:type 2 isopentenyl-diphosphate Delta-isomerase [Bacillaceae bacterium SIJ1]|uniref:type 2 isopentenyl-diphosphate Delta-isomerase n=1 Tax=Litoribacterium kuwaitense TaxID=1398745 RepID=UPI0013EDB175|nr:type 2 isopentenyl-diphosphate Delta-isomerase [Litoribacterium kuwaitense]NGP43694.1 type 2 isopentenyl-diphosphate Delta-isomerase [Litoribacterium kuwaitense]